MEVKDLIEKLRTMPQDATVLLEYASCEYVTDAGFVEANEDALTVTIS